MLSRDELSNGILFILKLPYGPGQFAYWVQTLRGEEARRWYEIYRRSDWEALRAQAAQVFVKRVSEVDANRARRRVRCVVIHCDAVSADQLKGSPQMPAPRQPGWENEGGSLSVPAPEGG
jgi:hypothetical protein